MLPAMDLVDTEGKISSVSTVPGSWSPRVGRSVSESKVSKRKLSFSFKRSKTLYPRTCRSPYKSIPISADIATISNLSSPNFSFDEFAEEELLRPEKSKEQHESILPVVLPTPIHNHRLPTFDSNISSHIGEDGTAQKLMKTLEPSENVIEPENNRVKEEDSEPKRFILSALPVSLLFLITLGCLIAVLIVLLRQRNTTVFDIFDHMNPSHRTHVLRQLNKIYLDDIPLQSKIPELSTSSTYISIPTPGRNTLHSRNNTARYLHGIAYAPRTPHKPCALEYEDVSLDIAELSKITTRVRNYAVHCNQAEYIIRAIIEKNLNMSLALGIWIGKSRKENMEQFRILKDVLYKYLDQNIIDSIFVGNEVLFRNDMSKAQLIKHINQTRSFVSSLGEKGKQIKVGTSELGSLVDNELASSCDILGVNVHPFFSGSPVEKSVQWVFDYLLQQIGNKLSPVNHQKLTIAEVGWPFSGGSYQEAIASPTKAQYFFKDFVTNARDYQYPYYYFEAFDEPWKEVFYEGNNTWETEWGIYDAKRNIKVDINSII